MSDLEPSAPARAHDSEAPPAYSMDPPSDGLIEALSELTIAASDAPPITSIRPGDLAEEAEVNLAIWRSEGEAADAQAAEAGTETLRCDEASRVAKKVQECIDSINLSVDYAARERDIMFAMTVTTARIDQAKRDRHRSILALVRGGADGLIVDAVRDRTKYALPIPGTEAEDQGVFMELERDLAAIPSMLSDWRCLMRSVRHIVCEGATLMAQTADREETVFRRILLEDMIPATT